jgi:CRISPR-associated Csh1 family protein
MIKTLYETGKILKNGFEDDYSDFFNPWQNPYPRSKEDSVVLVFHIEKGKLSDKVEMEKFSRNNLGKYLYRELAGARATSLVPTLFYYYTDKEDDKEESQAKFLDKVKRCFSDTKVKKAYNAYIPISELLADLKDKIQNITNLSKGNVLVTFKFDGQYVGEIKKFKEIIENEAYEKYSQKSFADNKICAITYENSEEVWGRVSTLGFTVDDEPFSRNGFDTKKSYKMFPVSPEAVKILEGTRKFAENKLSRNFYGLKYFIIPHFIAIDDKSKQYILEEFIDKIQNPNPSFQAEVNSIFENETITKEIVESENLSQNTVYYDIFFYQINNAQFLIKLHISDVLPTRFRLILDKKRMVEVFYNKITTIHSLKGKKEKEWIYYLTLANIKNYFSEQTQRGIVYHPYFFKIVESIFYGTKLNENTILTIFYNEVKKAFKQKEYFESAVKRTFAIYQFFYELNLFKNYQDMETPKQVPLDLDGFMKAHEPFFADDTKKAAFFLGCLTEKLLQKQRSKLSSEPFVKYLNGLNIDQTQMKKIHLKLMDKIPQYGDKFSKEEHEYIKRLNTEIAPRLIETSNLSKVDISYSFAIGLVMQKEFTNQYFENKKLEEKSKKL